MCAYTCVHDSFVMSFLGSLALDRSLTETRHSPLRLFDQCVPGILLISAIVIVIYSFVCVCVYVCMHVQMTGHECGGE